MAIRGKYNKDEQKMLADFKVAAENMSGWAKTLRSTVVTEEALKSVALAVDPWNPLWQDNHYAARSRWGGLISIPMYEYFMTQVSWLPEAPASLGYVAHAFLGEQWDFFKPLRVNDSLRVWRRPPQLEDVTPLDGKGPRTFKFLPNDFEHINQKDEIISTFKVFLEISLVEPPKRAEPTPDYVYTKEELDLIERTFNEEEILGAKVRYWEDVKVGDTLKPTVIGPTTIWDMLVFTAGIREAELVPMLEMRRRAKGRLPVDTTTGVTHHFIEHHLHTMGAQNIGMPHGFHYGAYARQNMARCVTNWMGDDGFIKRFSWRHLTVTSIGDASICRGKVTGKRVENGEHLVDLALYLENMRGNITEASVATVSLMSREDIKATKI